MITELQIVDAIEMAESDIRGVAEITWEAWPTPDGSVDVYAERMRAGFVNDPGSNEQVMRFAMVKIEGSPVATARTFARNIDTANGPMTIMALAGVACLESHRGRGFGRAVVEASFDRVREGAFELSLFQTTTNVRPFYEKLGCASVDNPAVNSLNADDPGVRPWWDPEVLIFPGQSPRWPAGTIDLRGPAW